MESFNYVLNMVKNLFRKKRNKESQSGEARKIVENTEIKIKKPRDSGIELFRIKLS